MDYADSEDIIEPDENPTKPENNQVGNKLSQNKAYFLSKGVDNALNS